eukprot:SAG11_NODE_32144_length_286_cov_0.545455_1_plen_42_part_10
MAPCFCSYGGIRQRDPSGYLTGAAERPHLYADIPTLVLRQVD